jgi:hypothetical protein
VGYIYVLRFTSGTLKVGHTTRPRVRVTQHKSAARVHGASIDRLWISPPHANYRDNEDRLVALCGREWVPINDEYFAGGDFDVAVGFAGRMPMEPTAEPMKEFDGPSFLRPRIRAREIPFPPVPAEHDAFIRGRLSEGLV